jgi:hypothetical protein
LTFFLEKKISLQDSLKLTIIDYEYFALLQKGLYTVDYLNSIVAEMQKGSFFRNHESLEIS